MLVSVNYFCVTEQDIVIILYKKVFYVNFQTLRTPSFLKISKISNKLMKDEIVTFDSLLKPKCNINAISRFFPLNVLSTF